ncbi:MAG: ribonuclease HII [Candidatus Margulisbacteria bacterium]|nr:ribonuclease HII [Candidatus Margulisiibacteriota bacterium]MBU1617407.1 ribonuclease HII [Candidatus Margulisiibacteriota bacterium]
MLSAVYENRLARQGFKLIAGVDEAGRGPLAGPLVAAAVILPNKYFLPGLNDSKQLTARQREKLFKEISKCAISVGISTISHLEIDRINIGRANFLAMERAVRKLAVRPDYLLIDGERYRIKSNVPARGINGGDAKSPSIAAASILAKVTRDRLMGKYHEKYPEYNFFAHKGYGTREHLLLLKQWGPCPIHRRSFSPVAKTLCSA